MHTLPADDASRPPAFLRIESVTAGYGGIPVIVNVSATVGSGEVVSVIGPNGAGKSTLLKAITGQLRVLEGSIRLKDQNVTNTPTSELARKGIGYVPQVNDVFADLTVKENLEMGGYLLAAGMIGERVRKVTAIFPLLEALLSRPAVKLSGGERKLVAIGRAMMMSPQLMLLDEPTASLSPKLSTELLRDHVRRLADTGTAVLLVEQKASAALKISDWAYVMVSGTVRLAGSARDVLARQDFGEVYLGSKMDNDRSVVEG